jgi:hypothetical protein
MAARLVKGNFMSLRKSFQRSPAFLAARRCYGRRCAGAKTPKKRQTISRGGAEAPSQANQTRALPLRFFAPWRLCVRLFGICLLMERTQLFVLFLRNETGMSFRIRAASGKPFFVPYFRGTKLECPLESIKARGTNPNTNPNYGGTNPTMVNQNHGATSGGIFPPDDRFAGAFEHRFRPTPVARVSRTKGSPHIPNRQDLFLHSSSKERELPEG